MDLARAGNRYFDEKAPWKSRTEDKEDCGTTLNCSLQLAKALALVCYPVIPETAEKIWSMLALKGSVSGLNWHEEKTRELESGHELGEPEVMFTKIEDGQIEKELERLIKMVDSNKPDTDLKSEETTGVITFDQFQKVRLKVAEILAAEPVEKSNKLVRLDIDVGKEKRQIVAGIKEYYPDPDKLTGRKIIVVTNLKPVTLMGIKSRGMLLAANSEKGLYLISPDPGAQPGDDVS
jgi:methionyl-tRNA synthetase